MKLLFSSELYAIDPNDLARLPDRSADEGAQVRVRDNIVIRIGNAALGESDVLLRGSAAVEQAITDGVEYIPVRIAFRSGIPRGLSFLSAFKQSRKKFRYHSAGVYHMSAREIRRMRIERAIRNKANAYVMSYRKRRPQENERIPKYQRLVESIARNGYDDSEPIRVMLCRSFGILDSLNQGHHRIAAALDAGVDRIAVSFTAVSKPPAIMVPFLLIPARLKRMRLHNQQGKA